MIEVGDLVRIARSTNYKNKLAIVVGIDHRGAICAILFLDTNEKENYHISRLEKL